MNDLAAFAQHARRMATAEHKPECVDRRDAWERALWLTGYFDTPHPGPKPECWGCVTPEDRALWGRLADEAEAYLARDEEGMLL